MTPYENAKTSPFARATADAPVLTHSFTKPLKPIAGSYDNQNAMVHLGFTGAIGTAAFIMSALSIYTSITDSGKIVIGVAITAILTLLLLRITMATILPLAEAPPFENAVRIDGDTAVIFPRDDLTILYFTEDGTPLYGYQCIDHEQSSTKQLVFDVAGLHSERAYYNDPDKHEAIKRYKQETQPDSVALAKIVKSIIDSKTHHDNAVINDLQNHLHAKAPLPEHLVLYKTAQNSREKLSAEIDGAERDADQLLRENKSIIENIHKKENVL